MGYTLWSDFIIPLQHAWYRQCIPTRIGWSVGIIQPITMIRNLKGPYKFLIWCKVFSRWRYQMKKILALLAFYEGKPLVMGHSLLKRAVIFYLSFVGIRTNCLINSRVAGDFNAKTYMWQHIYIKNVIHLFSYFLILLQSVIYYVGCKP